MAEENEVSSVPEKQKNETKEESHNSNDIELIDLSNDEEEQGKQAENDNEENDDDNKEIQNGNDDEDGNDENENSNEVSNQKVSDDEIMISDDDEDDEEEEPEQETMEINDDEDDASQEKCETSDNNFNANHTSKKVNSQSTKDEIIIDDDDDDEVQDLSTKSNSSLEDLVPKISTEQLGFPKCFKDVISLGECIAINKKSRSDIDIDKEYSILDCPSQVVPLIIKRSNKFPSKIKVDKDEAKQLNPPSTASNQNTKNMLTISDFYSSSIGKFLIGVGLSRVKQWYHKDTINKVRKQIRKEGEAEDLMEELKKQQEYFSSCRIANSSYTFSTEKCEHCEFRTEFKLVLNNHLNYPHTTSRKELKCNYCQFSTRDSKVIIGHVNVLHEKKCFIELPPQLYECPICPYESGVKSKAATHIAKCLKFFVPDKLLVNKDDYFPTITPKPITQEDIKIYEATLQALRFAALNPQNKVPQIPGLPSGLQQNVYSAQQQMARTGRPKAPPSKNVRQISPFLMNQVNLKNVSPQLYQMLSNAPHGQFLQNPSAAQGFSAIQANPLIKSHQQMLAKMSSTANAAVRSPHNSAYSKPNIIAKQQNNNSSNNRADNANPKGSFVMCEICDGYIKDLEQLRTHMHWIHKVRIHPKMLASRPPLNCQKCQWRFFTDQGLERHLLGAHGLVTSNMQDMVNQNQDGGRCTICGRVFTNKLVTHMNQTHKINLKPAHLSYKCTVCSATFNLYRLFENHVYMVHSGSVKRNANDESNQPPRKKAAIDSIVPQATAAANGN